MKMEVVQLTVESIEAARANWTTAAIESDMPETDVEMRMDWAAKHISYADQAAAFAYGIVDDQKRIVGLMDIYYSKRPGKDQGWLKMMQLYLSPEYSYEVVKDNADKILTVADIYTAAITGTIELTGAHKARVVKIFGRDELLFTILVALKTQLAAIATFNVTIEGRWLVLSPKE